jgi:hypothetical protein
VGQTSTQKSSFWRFSRVFRDFCVLKWPYLWHQLSLERTRLAGATPGLLKSPGQPDLDGPDTHMITKVVETKQN